MEQKKVLIPKKYVNRSGEEQTFWNSVGYGFIRRGEDQTETAVNLYLDVLPFQPSLRIFLGSKDRKQNAKS